MFRFDISFILPETYRTLIKNEYSGIKSEQNFSKQTNGEKTRPIGDPRNRPLPN